MIRQCSWPALSRSRLCSKLLRLLVLMSLTAPFASAVFAASLEDVDFVSLPGNQVEIKLGFSDAPARPSDFATENPARIAIDFPNATSRLGRKPIPIGVGPAQSLVAIEASDRTRVVINLNQSVPYSLETRGNQVSVALNPGPRTAPSRSRALLGSERTAQAVTRVRGGALKDIDFRRGSEGEGRVIINLPSSDTRVNVAEEGRDVVVGIADTRLPQRLLRRLDVVDFGTPVVAVESRPEGDDVRVDIQTAAEFDYLAYQTGNLFTIEFRALTPAKKEQLEREKIVFSGDRLSLNFQDIEVRAVLQMIADFTGLNLVASDTVQGGITLRLKNVPWDQALDIILKTKGLAMRRTGNVIMVAPAEELAGRERLQLESRQKIQELAPLRTEFIQINYAKAEDIAEILKGYRDEASEITQLGDGGPLQLLAGERQAPMLSARGSVAFDERTNAIIVNETVERLMAIRELIAKLDVPVRQVLIESRVVIANNNFARDLGVRFGVSGSVGRSGDNELLVGGGEINDGVGLGPYGFFDIGEFGGDSQGGRFNVPLQRGAGNEIRNDAGAPNLWVNLPAPDPAGAVNFLLGKVGSHLITLELSAMQREGRGEIISSPRVVTADQTPAVIEVGQDIPVVTPATAEQPASVRYEPATLKLDVTPHITPDGRVIMDLKVNKDEADFTFTVDGNPLRNRRAVETSVLVDNGETIVLGGVFEGQKDFSVEKVPWLGDLPVVGRLFKSTSRLESNQELLIFVTPKILKSDLAVR
ncbi:pilus assembly protein PilQ [Halochromatium glycolicum]|uniref:Pilus assembly protein PilQ n=2 Tax=Halochromatium glycolicum TaxID=85075 RepID=A0AAJ0U3Y9_9GAMM|nr:pilus assembly protein PilQ [Halochromatium glycolicum]